MVKAIDLTYTIRDNKGKDATTSVKLDPGASLVDCQEFAEAQATALDAILYGRVQGAQVNVPVDVSGLTTNLSSGADDVENIGSFQFRTADGRPVIVNIPCFDESMVVAGSDGINQSNPAVAAFLAMMTNGLSVTGGTIIPCDVGEDDIVTVDYARERTRASGKRG